MAPIDRTVALSLSSLVLAVALAAAPRAALAYGYTVTPYTWETWIPDSGKDNSGTAEYICPDNQAMIGRWHRLDGEVGYTTYLCGKVYYNGAEVPISTSPYYARWSPYMREAGSDYTCPANMVMTGSRVTGGVNGNTAYLCTPIIYGGNFVVLKWRDWSEPIEESGKSNDGQTKFICPTDKVMVGRRHEGDRNGNTGYLCATIVASQTPVMLGTPQLTPLGPYQESGKKSGGQSSFTCSSNTVMVFRSHNDDENGNTYYNCVSGTVQGIPFTTSAGTWGSWMQESGKKTGGESHETCPPRQFMVGREHKGDENGNTEYKCAYVLFKGEVGDWGVTTWSPWVKESKSSYTCPFDQAMIGREHKGDENGNTRYQCASIVMPFMATTLSQAVENAVRQVGSPATTTPAKFATRDSMKIDDDYFLNLDVWGEGYHVYPGITSGFVGAINVNVRDTDSQPPHDPIPLLVRIDSWERSPLPFADRIANYITMQGAPLTEYYAGEIARVIAPEGQIGLWIDPKDPQIYLLAKALKSEPVSSVPVGSTCFDEFAGIFPDPKTCIANKRP